MGIAEQGYCLPLHAPLYFRRVGQQVLWWKGINFVCHAAPEALRRFIPHPLQLQDDKVTVTVTEHYQPGHGLPVFGCGVFLHARFRDTVGSYPIVTFSDSDEVVCANREELGGPALLCDHSGLVYEGNTVSAVVRRHDQLLLAASVFLDVQSGGHVPIWGEGEPLLHYKKIPNGDPNGKPLREIVAIRSNRSEGKVIHFNSGRGSLELGTTVWNFHLVGPLDITNANFMHFEGGFLESAKVLWAE